MALLPLRQLSFFEIRINSISISTAMNTPQAESNPNSGSKSSIFLFTILASVMAFGLMLLSFWGAGLMEPGESKGQALGLTSGIEQEDPSSLNYVPGTAVLRIKDAYRQDCYADRITIQGLDQMLVAEGVGSVSKAIPGARPVGDRRNQLGQAFVDLSLIYNIRFSSSTDVVALCQRISQHPAVQYIEPRIEHEIFYTPDDTYYPYQWYLDTIGAPVAWDQTQGDSTIVIGIIDTGTSFTHADLTNQVAYNPADPIDGIDNDNDGYVDNYRGWDFGGTSYWAPADNDPSYVGNAPGMDHGVLVTGAACAEPDNANGITGVGFHTRFLPLKGGVDQSTSISFGFDAVIYAADHDVDIINLSWGSSSASNFGQDAINYATINQGCLVVAAAGNRYQNTFVYPASFENVLSVGATATNDTVWDNGTGTGTTFNYYVDMMAPGKSIMTTAGAEGYWSGSTGTSMSSPIACAGAAIIRARYPQLSNVQAGELMRVSAESIYAKNPANLAYKMGKGRLDLENAVSMTNHRSVRIDSMMIRDDANDIPEPFDTLEVYNRFLNYLDPVQNLQVTVSTPDTDYLEILSPTTTVGAIATMGSKVNSTPFRFRVIKDITQKKKVYLKFEFSDGTYSDYQYCTFYLSPTVLNLDQNKLHTSINGTGNFGFTDYPNNDNGIGLTYSNSNNVIQDGGFLVAISPSKVVDNLKGQSFGRSQRFTLEEKAHRIFPGNIADLEATSTYNDSDAGSHEIGIKVDQHNYQFSTGDHQQYIVFEYTVTNTNSYPVNGVYAGMGAQWNRSHMETSNANYLPGQQTVAVEFSAPSAPSFAAGISLLTEQPVNAKIADLQNYSFSDFDKFNALSNPVTANTARAGDIVEFISAGPFNLPSGGSEVIAFAMVAGSDYPELQEVADNALRQYWCTIRGQTPNADLGPDLAVCSDQSLPPTLDPLGGTGVSYEWSTGDTSATLTPTQSGIYAVTVTNSHGCEAVDEIEVDFRSLSGATLELPVNGFQPGSPLQFNVLNSPSLTSWQWDFGDGNSTFGSNSASHSYTTQGSYPLSVTISDGVCTQTIDTVVNINPLVGIDDNLAAGIQVSPNPFVDQIRVSLPDGLTEVNHARLFDATGKLVFEKVFPNGMANQSLLELPDVGKGVYFLHLEGKDLRQTRRMLHR